MDMYEEKRLIRRKALAARRGMTEDARAEASDKIQKLLFDMDEYLGARCVFPYASMDEEVHTENIILDLLGSGKTVCLPYIVGNSAMEAVRLKSMLDLEPGKYDILTVREDEKTIVEPEKIDLVLVPGVAFTRSGDRLGMGGGYYDNFLKSAVKARRVALTYDCQIFETLPMSDNDEKVDKIVTESGIIDCKQK